MTKLRWIVFIGGSLAVVPAIHAADIRVVLLDAENKPVRHSEAAVFARGVKEGWREGVLFNPDRGWYRARLDNVDHLDIVIYTAAGTQQRTIEGLSGRHDQTLYLRADHAVMRCGSGQTDSGIPLAVIEFVDDLDEAYPNGLPRQATNTRAVLKEFGVRALDKLPAPEDPEHAKEIQALRDRINRHLQ